MTNKDEPTVKWQSELEGGQGAQKLSPKTVKR
jgi:hypothetical protein